MSTVLQIPSDAVRALAIEAFRSLATQRAVVARRAAQALTRDKSTEKRDIRSQSVKVTALLAESQDLEDLALALESTPTIALVAVTATTVTPEPPEPVEAPRGDDDGTSLAAQAAAALAGLTEEPVIDDDFDTGSIAEDEPQPDQLDVEF